MRKAMAATTMPPAIDGDLRPISGVITDYAGFVKAMIDRRHELGVTQMELAEIAGLAEGHTGKLERWNAQWGRSMGPRTLPLWLGGLKCGIVLVDLRTGQPIAPDEPTAARLSLVRHAR